MTPCPCLHKALHVSLRFHVTSGNFHFILGNHLSKAARNESVTFVVCGVSSNQVHIQSSRFSLSAQRPRIYQDVESEVFSSSTEIRIYQDVESEVSSPAQRPGSARTWNQKFPHQHRDPDLPGRGIRSVLTSTEARVCQDADSGADRCLLREALLPMEPCVLQTQGC